ncbi:MAG: GAF domain-containing protein [Methanobacteriota archaeon]|nr:MAG: GAF domain-containing protein [Euryarchaeota archaeon]
MGGNGSVPGRNGLESAQLLLLKEISESANRGVALDEILQRAVEGVADIFGYDACDVFLLEDDGCLRYAALAIDSAVKAAVERLTGLTIIGFRIPLFDGSCFKEVLDSGRPIVLDDMVRVFEDFTDDKRLRRFAPGVARIVGFKKVLRVPLISNGRALGVLGAAVKGDVPLELPALELFSAHLAVVVERMHLEEQVKEYTRELERKVEERTAQLKIAYEKVSAALEELEEKNAELERFNRFMVGRELKMVELKKKIKELEARLMNEKR